MATPSDPRGGLQVPPPPPTRPSRPRPPIQSGPPAQPPPPGRARQPAGPVLQQRAFAALVLAVISLLGILGTGGNIRRGVVVLAVTMVIGAAGLWLSLTAMSRSRKAGTARPRFTVVANVLGFLGTGLSALALIGFALFWTQVSQYANCMSGANTVASQSACSQQLNNSLQAEMKFLAR